MKRKFSDLHCHNHMRAYFHMQESRKIFTRKGKFSPWTVIASNSRNAALGKMGASYSQIDLVKCWNSNLRLTFNSLYPLERQFVIGMDPKIAEDKWYHFLARGVLGRSGIRRDLLQTSYMRIPDKVVDYFQSSSYDYWESLNREKDFVLIDSGNRIQKNQVHVPGALLGDKKAAEKRAKKDPGSYIATNACYRIPKTRSELLESLKNDSEITMIITIEGAHALGTDRVKSVQEISERVRFIKTKWEFPVFFLTFAHHFDNRLCGHAHSIPGKGKILLKQRPHMNEGFRRNGRRIIREILGLDQEGKRDISLGYRILIDVKHMAARSRVEYYELVKNCLERGDRIPVIASHCGYSGIQTLQAHIDLEKKEKDDYTDVSGKFNAWNINMCDEDIEMIVKTGGLFGLSLDQRILGITSGDLQADKVKTKKRNGIQVIWENIEAIVKSAYTNPNLNESEKLRIWKCLCIGSDFEGLVDPVNSFPTALDFNELAIQLMEEIAQSRINSQANHLDYLKSRAEVEKWVDDFCYNNAESFLIEHYPFEI
jgi:microsomal dipeptidase-like Zn-dependent dipeptidase